MEVAPTVDPLELWTFIVVLFGTVATIGHFAWNWWTDKRKVKIKTWRATERRGERIWPVINIKVTNHMRRIINIEEIGLTMSNKEEISVPLHMFGDRVSFSINSEDNETYPLSLIPLHMLPNKEYFTSQLERSKDAETFARNHAMLEFADKIKRQNAWINTKKVYIKDATGHVDSGKVTKKVKQAFDI
jgi:hypothetical protein